MGSESDYHAAWVPGGSMSRSAFIIYSHSDSSLAERLANDLRRHSVDVWIDKWKIQVGDSIVAKINQGLGSRDFLIVILTAASIESRWVNLELDAAIVRQLDERGVSVLPILADDSAIPPLLKGKRYADFRGNRYHLGLSEVLEVIDAGQPSLVDVNAHLWLADYDADRDEVMSRARRLGIRRIIASGCSGPESWHRSLAIADRFGGAYASLALHPDHGAEDLSSLEHFVKHPKVVAIGDAQIREVLGPNNKTADVDYQRRLMIHHLALADKYDLPLVVELQDHEFSAEDVFVEIIKEQDPRIPIVVQVPQWERLDFYLDRGFYFLVNGMITFPRADSLRTKLAEAIPLDRVLVGSDCPWSAPVPQRGERNEPMLINVVAEEVARILTTTTDEVCSVTTATAERVFRFAAHDERHRAAFTRNFWKTHG
jgi:TatD DNase family protein